MPRFSRVRLVSAAIAAAGALAACSQPPRSDPNPPITDQFTTSDGIRLGVQTLITGLQIPWSMAFAPDGRLFFTERPGRVRVFQDGALVESPALTLDDVSAVGEGGLLGIALRPLFGVNHQVYLLYTAATPDGAVNRLVRYRESGNTLADRAILFDRMDADAIHNGGRIKFGPDGKLYLTMGDAADTSNPQSLSSFNGKILRLNDDGTTPSDNPFGSPIWSWGHRNPQGIDWDPSTADLWESEHGATGNDEINVIQRGRNYGWPVIEADQTRPDMESPLRFFTPSVAPSGGSFYRGNAIPGLRSSFLVGTLAGQHIERLIVSAGPPPRIDASERWLEGTFGRIRDVVIGPDGAIYFCTSNRDGRTTPVAGDDRLARIVAVDSRSK
jgi:glucose/arabinose dehydrogenase